MAGRIARGDIRLYQFAAPDKRRPVVVLTRDSATLLPVHRDRCSHYFHDPWCSF